jgi:hypothetical protein
LPPAARWRRLRQGRDPIHALPFPDQPLSQTIHAVWLKNKAVGIGDQIRRTAVAALTQQFLPNAKRLLPQCLTMIKIHRSGNRESGRIGAL